MFEIDNRRHASTTTPHDHNSTDLAIGDPDSEAYIFAASGELLGDALITAGDDGSVIPSNFTLKGVDRLEDGHHATFPQLDHLGIYGAYDESDPSSIRFGDSHELSDRAGSQMSTKGDINEPVGNVVNGTSGVNNINGKHVDGSLNGSNGGHICAQSSTGSHPTQKNGQPAKISSSTPRSKKLNSPAQRKGIRVNGPANPAAHQVLDNQFNSSLPAESLLDPATHSPPLTDAKRANTLNGTGMAKTKNQLGQYSGRGRPPKKTEPEFRAKTSIPAKLAPEEYAHECIMAALAARLNPFALHPGEHKLLREHITHPQVTNYLNARNAILRLWTKNPLLCVVKSEAAGCAKESRCINMALVAFQWLLRNGYINFGCLEVPRNIGPVPRMLSKRRRQKTIVIIGAGMSGLGCARQLEGIFSQLGEQWTAGAEKPPKVIVLEGRQRIGGRIYSAPLSSQQKSSLPDPLRNTADMGAQIVTGFEHGNPLNAIIRGQLGVSCHVLRDNSVLYDWDGKLVDKSRDVMVEKLYNDILERAAAFRHQQPPINTVEGNRDLIERGRDSGAESESVIATLEDSGLPIVTPRNRFGRKYGVVENAPAVSEKLAGRAYFTTGSSTEPAAKSATGMGWSLQQDVSVEQTISLETAAQSSGHPTLGETMDEGIKQFQNLMEVTPLDLRLLNWHHANLEYANAVNVNQLSLGGWDQDIGNEFDGSHCTIIGGYQQVPRGLHLSPSKLDVRFQKTIRKITYSTDPTEDVPAASVHCDDGEVIDADRVIVTASLGVLKSGDMTFEPPLPEWKLGAIDRLGFGLLNKIVLVYEKPFWEEDRDMFGLLNSGASPTSLDTTDYEENRGRFYLFWNCIKTSGRPMLVALMAGNAAHTVESTPDSVLVSEATGRLSQIFAPKQVPQPTEALVTRWRRDPFARGSYSYVGPTAQPGDYDAMAKPVGPVHFAGEATCGTHPATVHGAYLSGLRAASDIVESLIGPVKVPTPLVPPRQRTGGAATTDNTPLTTPAKRALNGDIVSATQTTLGGLGSFIATSNGLNSTPQPPPLPTNLTPAPAVSSTTAPAPTAPTLTTQIESLIGPCPSKPPRRTANPFLFYTRDHWGRIKAAVDAAHPRGHASRVEIRTKLGKAWREESEEVRVPYFDEAERVKGDSKRRDAEWGVAVREWEERADRVGREIVEGKKGVGEEGENEGGDEAGKEHVGGEEEGRVDGEEKSRVDEIKDGLLDASAAAGAHEGEGVTEQVDADAGDQVKVEGQESAEKQEVPVEEGKEGEGGDEDGVGADIDMERVEAIDEHAEDDDGAADVLMEAVVVMEEVDDNDEGEGSNFSGSSGRLEDEIILGSLDGVQEAIEARNGGSSKGTR